MKARTYRSVGAEKGRYVTPDLNYYWEGAREQREDNSTKHTCESGRLNQVSW